MTSNERHRIEVILEDMNGKFDLLLEGHATLDQKIDRVQAESREQHAEAMAMSKTVHDSLSTRIDGVEQRLDAKIDGVEQRLDSKIDSVRDELKDDIRAVGEKVDGHESRIQHLERKAA